MARKLETSEAVPYVSGTDVKRSSMQRIYQRLGKRIRKVRQDNAMPQAILAKKVGFSRVSVVNIEAARQRLQVHDIAHFAKALKMNPDKLMKSVWAEPKPRKLRRARSRFAEAAE